MHEPYNCLLNLSKRLEWNDLFLERSLSGSRKYSGTHISGYFDVSHGWRRRNLMLTALRCSSPIWGVGNPSNSITNISNLSPSESDQHHVVTNITMAHIYTLDSRTSPYHVQTKWKTQLSQLILTPSWIVPVVHVNFSIPFINSMSISWIRNWVWRSFHVKIFTLLLFIQFIAIMLQFSIFRQFLLKISTWNYFWNREIPIRNFF